MTLKESKDSYIKYIEEHVENVKKAWKLIEEKCPDILKAFDGMIVYRIDELIQKHDQSKYSQEEFDAYRQYFFTADKEIKNEELFNKAWEHHKQNNPHHWQIWTVGNFSDYDKYAYFIENMCDWIAMGFKFNDTAKVYYERNKHEIKLPQYYIDVMYKIFDKVYN